MSTKFESLQQEVFEANLDLVKEKLVKLTWGNASSIDRNEGIIAIKPSGVAYDKMKWSDIVLVDLDGKVVDSKLRPSSDTSSHIELYKGFAGIGSVVHTHSTWATIWAQAARSIPTLGTTHADHFYGPIPCIPYLTEQEVIYGYEKITGSAIVNEFNKLNLDPISMPACILAGHAPFCWGKTATEAVQNAIVLEEVAMMAHHSLQINSQATLPAYVLSKHYERKHGKSAYYGQKK